MAERLDAAIPDIEEVFSAEELLALWGEFEEGASSGAEARSSSGAGPSQHWALGVYRGTGRGEVDEWRD